MQVVASFPWENGQNWVDELRRQGERHDIQVWPDVADPGAIDAAVVWTPDRAFFRDLDNLRAILIPGAGVDQLFRSAGQLPDVPIVRLADPVMATRMAEYVLSTVLDHHRQFRRYRDQQAKRVWTRHHHPDAGDIRVGVLGLGVMGGAAANHLRAIGYPVTGWSRRPKDIQGIDTLSGQEGFEQIVRSSDVLVCLLPLTDQTRAILNAQTFDAMPDGAFVINAARGGHLVVSDLLAALDRGKLSGAALDVFDDEPLPEDDLLWRHPLVTVTPHIASLSNPVTGVRQIVRALDRIEDGAPLDHLVDPEAGY